MDSDLDLDLVFVRRRRAASSGARGTFARESPRLSLNLLRTSRSRRPRVGASTVTTSATAPIASARRTSFAVASLSRRTYSWNHRTPSPALVADALDGGGGLLRGAVGDAGGGARARRGALTVGVRHLLHGDGRDDQGRGEGTEAEGRDRATRVDVGDVHQAPRPKTDGGVRGGVGAERGLGLGACARGCGTGASGGGGNDRESPGAETETTLRARAVSENSGVSGKEGEPPAK